MHFMDNRAIQLRLLSSIFSTLRKTEQYLRKPRSDLNCMIQHYGPATWSLTLSLSEYLWDELGEYIRKVNGWSNDSSLSTSVLIACINIEIS